MQIRGRVQPGVGDASKWIRLFAAAYEQKAGHAIFPGSLNLNLGEAFDWHSPFLVERHIWFDRSEMGGERDVLLVPCVLTSLADLPAFLWSTTNAATDRDDPWVVELICEVGLRDEFGLHDGDDVLLKIP
jgi:CTP-dependent riboflavin kinase